METSPQESAGSSGQTMREQQEQMVRDATNLVSAVSDSAAEFVSGSIRICSDLAIGLTSALLRVPAAVMQGTILRDADGRNVPGIVSKAIQDSADLVTRSSKRFTEGYRSGQDQS